MPIKVIVADDHPIIFEGVKAMLQKENNIEVCEFVAEIQDLPFHIKTYQPDLLLCDVNFHGRNALQEISFFKTLCPKMKILIFSSYDTDSVLREALAVGVNGFLLKNTTKEEFLHAVSVVMNEEFYLSPFIKKFTNYSEESKIIDVFQQKIKLSEREKEIIRYIVKGLENEAIAEQLFISLHTVRTHRKNIFHKLNIHSATELTKLVLTQHILD